MSFDKAMEKSPENNDKNTSLTPSAAKLSRILGTSPTPRMLTSYEIKLLRKSKKEMDQVVGEAPERKRDKLQD